MNKMGAHFWKFDVIELVGSKMNQRVMKSFTSTSRVTKFDMIKENLGFKYVEELMLMRNTRDESFESTRRSCKCCCFQCCVVVIEGDSNWNRLKGGHIVPGINAMKYWELHIGWFNQMVQECGKKATLESINHGHLGLDEFNQVWKKGLSDDLVVCNQLVHKCRRYMTTEGGTYKGCRSFEEQGLCLRVTVGQ